MSISGALLSLFMLMGMNISSKKDSEEKLLRRFPVRWSLKTETGNILSCMSSIWAWFLTYIGNVHFNTSVRIMLNRMAS